jgi:hypothetical protein
MEWFKEIQLIKNHEQLQLDGEICGIKEEKYRSVFFFFF